MTATPFRDGSAPGAAARERLAAIPPALLVGAFTFTWALIEQLGPAAGVPAYQVVWTRYGVHLALLALLFGRRHGLGLVRSVHLGRELLSSLAMLGMPVCFILAVHRMPVRDAMAVFWVAPVLIVTASAAVGGVMDLRTLGAPLVGLAGALLICRPGAGTIAPSALLALAMAACFALYVVTVGTMHREAVLPKLFHTALWVFAILTVVLPRFWHTPTLRGFAAMVLIGALGCAGLYALDVALSTAPAAVVAPVLYTQLVWDLWLQLLRGGFHAALPSRFALVGVVLILVAAASAFVADGRRAYSSVH